MVRSPGRAPAWGPVLSYYAPKSTFLTPSHSRLAISMQLSRTFVPSCPSQRLPGILACGDETDPSWRSLPQQPGPKDLPGQGAPDDDPESRLSRKGSNSEQGLRTAGAGGGV